MYIDEISWRAYNDVLVTDVINQRRDVSGNKPGSN